MSFFALRRTRFQLLEEPSFFSEAGGEPLIYYIQKKSKNQMITQPTSLRCSARSDDSTYRPKETEPGRSQSH
uniref:Uncharacterized protein n=1 Tax=Raphanus sativus TaxID=3726 RepID=A0A650GAW9_RAPSA|nr:hypothetical protein [Raphanus sativus]QGW48636.1 hypothetical protein [Raphanus sativus]